MPYDEARKVLKIAAGLVRRHGINDMRATTSGYGGSFELLLAWQLFVPIVKPIYVAIPGDTRTEHILEITPPERLELFFPDIKGLITKWVDEAIELALGAADPSGYFTIFDSQRRIRHGSIQDWYQFRMEPIPVDPGIPRLRNSNAKTALAAWRSFFVGFDGDYFGRQSIQIQVADLYGTFTIATGFIRRIPRNDASVETAR